MREGTDMGWHGRIPLLRLIGETVWPIGFYAAGSPADLFACLDSHALIRWTLEQGLCPFPAFSTNHLEVCT